VTARRRAPHGLGATDYDQDLDAWSQEQVHVLRAGAWSRLDIEHLADEIADVGRSEHRALAVIRLHMLKWDHQPGRRSRSWATSIRIQRLIVQERLDDSPSLRPQAGELVTRAYRRARIEATGEIGLDEETFPQVCPYTWEVIMTRSIPWPPADPQA